MSIFAVLLVKMLKEIPSQDLFSKSGGTSTVRGVVAYVTHKAQERSSRWNSFAVYGQFNDPSLYLTIFIKRQECHWPRSHPHSFADSSFPHRSNCNIMRLTPRLTLPILLLSLPAFADRTTAEIVQDANRLLSEGSYNEAARVYGEAIGA